MNAILKPDAKVIGTRLLELRTEHQWSQTKLAELSGVNVSSIKMYEQGRRNPKVECLEHLADALDTNPDYLMGKTDDKQNHKRIYEMIRQRMNDEGHDLDSFINQMVTFWKFAESIGLNQDDFTEDEKSEMQSRITIMMQTYKTTDWKHFDELIESLSNGTLTIVQTRKDD